MVIAGYAVREEERETWYEAIDACLPASVCRNWNSRRAGVGRWIPI